MRLKHLLSVFLTLLTLAVGNVWGALTNTYIKMTSATELDENAEYVIGNVDSYGCPTAIGGTGINTTEANWFRWNAANGENGFYLYSGSTYITVPSGNAWGSGTSSNKSLLTTNSEGIVTGVNGTTTRILVKNSSNAYLRWYNSGQTKAYLYKVVSSCDKKVTLTKGTPSNGTFTLDKSNGAHNNCDANFVVTVSNINPTNSSYYCTGVSATGGNSSVSGPDGSGNYTVTYTKGNSITSTVTANFAAKTSRTVTFMRNGVQYGDVRNVYDGDAVGTLPSNPTSCDANKVFAGWSEAQIGSTPTDDAPTFISASTVVSGSNKVYHAVFATDATPAGNLFSWEGSSTNDLASLTGMTGVTSIGLGSYAAGNAPYRVQFDNSSDYITISLSSAPSALTLTTKKIGGAGNSSFTIQESTASNGTFTDVQTFTCTGAQNATATHTTSTAFKTTTRAIKITFSKASNGNTGVGSIIITPGASYSGYITSCCTELASINGSFFLNQSFDPFYPSFLLILFSLCQRSFLQFISSALQ